jgi:hypothetical protein
MFFSGSQVHAELDKLLLTSPAGWVPCPLVEAPVILEEGVDPPGACRLMNLAKCSNILCAVSPSRFGCTVLVQLGFHFTTPWNSVYVYPHPGNKLCAGTRDVRERGEHSRVPRGSARWAPLNPAILSPTHPSPRTGATAIARWALLNLNPAGTCLWIYVGATSIMVSTAMDRIRVVSYGT